MPVVYSKGTVYRETRLLKQTDRARDFWWYREEELQRREDGFYYVRRGENSCVVVFGSGYYADMWVESESRAALTHAIPDWIEPQRRRAALLSGGRRETADQHAGTGFWVMDDGIESIRVPSSLGETVAGVRLEYSPERMRYPFAAWGEFNIVFYNDALAWVEDEPGAGPGVELEVLFDTPKDHIIVLNGFVDLRRRHLYRMNSRMRQAEIRCEDFAIIHSFDDEVKFQRIDFPSSTEWVSLRVVSVYPGSRWTDLAITALFTETAPRADARELRLKTANWVRHAEWLRRAFTEREREGRDRRQ
jgi:hypothetical protein